MRLEYRVWPRGVLFFLVGIAAYLGIQSLIFEYLVEEILDQRTYPYVAMVLDLFSLNTEQTLPAWYTSLLLFGAALLFLLIASAKWLIQARERWLWAGLFAIFTYLSMDEAASIHEIAAEWLQNDFQLTGFWTFGWQLVAAPFLLLFGLVYVGFWWRLPGRTRLHFMLAGMVYVGGAFVIEGVSAARWDELGGVSYSYLVIASLEEFCEMLGVILLIYGQLTYAINEGYTLDFKPLRPLSPPRLGLQRWMAVLPVLVLMNIVVIAWVVNLPTNDGARNGEYSYQSLMDQLTVDGMVVGRDAGRFAFDSPPDPMLRTLAEQFPEVWVINLISADSYVMLAGENLPFTQDDLINILHENGEMQFVILDDAAVRLILRANAP